MFKFIGKALAGMVLDSDARKAVVSRTAPAKVPTAAANKQADNKQAAIAQMQAQVRGVMTEDRAELIRNAMKVRAAKQSVLADLSDEDRARLVATAMKALLNEGRNKQE